MTRLHHIANGTSTTNTFHLAGIPGTYSIWADPLHEGPVPGGIDDGELMEVRRRFLTPPEPIDPMIDLREWRAALERHGTYDELVLWYEHDLFDQLNLLQLLTQIHERVPSDKRVSLICIGSFPGRPDFKGLGELTPGELAPLLDTRQRVTDAQYSLALRAWHAFREPAPHALDALRSSDTSALPFLAPAITRFLQEYPWTIDGLSRSERRLLQLVDAGTRDLATAFPRMHADESAYYIADGTLADLAESLSRMPSPLLSVSGSETDRMRLRVSLTLTETGKAVLSGRRDRVEIGGIDRWLGGVHLHDGNLWRWDETGQRIVT